MVILLNVSLRKATSLEHTPSPNTPRVTMTTIRWTKKQLMYLTRRQWTKLIAAVIDDNPSALEYFNFILSRERLTVRKPQYTSASLRSAKQLKRPEPVPLIIGNVSRVPLTRDGYEIIRSPNLTTKPNAKGKIVDRLFHGKGPTLWRVELRTQSGNGYSTEYVRCRTAKLAIKHIESKFHITGKAVI